MKQLLIMLMLLCSGTAFAQDVIVKKDGSTIVCRVVELTSTEIVYKKWSNLNGSNYVMNRSDASAINYENGKKVNLSEVTNLYKPNNQNDGIQQYNDKALLRLDYAASNPYKRAKSIRTIGWVAGSALFVTGLSFPMIFYKMDNDEWDNSGCLIPFLCCTVSGIATTTCCLIAANRIEKEARMNQAFSLYHHSFQFSNGSSMSAGIDLLSDLAANNKTLGLGLRYNF